MNIDQSCKFIYRNARPLDLARWQYLFEDGCKEAVLKALSVYQNPDGGFGHGLEADCLNPESSPVQTWCATQILKELNVEDRSEPIIQGMIKYLASGTYFDGHYWMKNIPSNNEHPHAPWWSCGEEDKQDYNPTASLAGFAIRYADADSKLYSCACKIAQEAYEYLRGSFPIDAFHTVNCFAELYEYLKAVPDHAGIDMQEFKELLRKHIDYSITKEHEKWAKEYVCKPSMFIKSKSSDFYPDNKEICSYECRFISDTQKADGTWNITWNWADYPEEWSLSKNYWKADLTINNIKFYKEFQA